MKKNGNGPRWGLLILAAGLMAASAAGPLIIAAEQAWAPGGAAGDLWDFAARAAFFGLQIAGVAGTVIAGAAFILPRPVPGAKARRARLNLYRTTAALRRIDPGAAGARACDRLSDDALRVAAILPGHSEAGRAAASAALARRGVALDPVPEIAAPSFFAPDDLADAPRAALAGERIRTIAGYTAAALLVGVFILAGLDATSDGTALGGHARDIGMALAALLIPAGLVVFLASWLRSRPVRMLLLRKFNERRLGRRYKRLIESELQPFGHVIALADSQVRRSTFEWFGGMLVRAVGSIQAAVVAIVTIPILMLLRATDRTRWGPALVASARDFRLLAARLEDRLELNVETTFIAKAYLIRTTDEWWRQVVRMLMASADVIVLDLSEVTQGTAWEIEAITRYGLWGRVVRVAADDRADAARAAVSGAPEAPLFLYDGAGGMADRPAFRAEFFAALVRSVRARGAETSVA